MKLTLKIEKEFDVKYLQANAGVRYWEDSEVDGVEDSEGSLIPCRDGDYWRPLIDVEDGQIVNWQSGKEAVIHYKVCDDGDYTLLDANKVEIIKIDGYVPKIMCPDKEGYGDYIKMHIDGNGFIKDWVADFEDFIDED